jgi:hypothetical protein
VVGAMSIQKKILEQKRETGFLTQAKLRCG